MKRAVRYGRRRYEFKLLGPRMRAGSVGALPVDITDVYGDAHALPLRWEGLYTWPNWVALQAMRRLGKNVLDRGGSGG